MRRLVYMLGVFMLRQGMGLMLWAAGDLDDDDEDTNAKVYDVVSGPHERWETDDDTDHVPESFEYYVVVLLEREGATKLEEYKMWFQDEDGCKYIIDHFKTSIDPINVRI